MAKCQIGAGCSELRVRRLQRLTLGDDLGRANSRRRICAALELTERRQQPDVQKAAVQLTQEVPYETACELFAELTGLPLSAHTAHEVTQAVAEGLTVLNVAPSREEVVAKIAAVAEGQPWRPILMLAIEGAEGA